MSSTPITAEGAVLRTHELKTDPGVFAAVLAGVKTHEIRMDDRHFAVGETLLLRETKFDGADMRLLPVTYPLIYTGRTATRTISHIQRGYGLKDGWCILSFATESAAIQPAGGLLTISEQGVFLATGERPPLQLSMGTYSLAPQDAKAEQAPMPMSYVQNVPDHCDRITWRGAYYMLREGEVIAPAASNVEAVSGQFSKLHHALEIIAVGDATNPSECAAQALVDAGIWLDLTDAPRPSAPIEAGELPSMECPQCGVDRLKEPCPRMADECAMVADAHLLDTARPASSVTSAPSKSLRDIEFDAPAIGSIADDGAGLSACACCGAPEGEWIVRPAQAVQGKASDAAPLPAQGLTDALPPLPWGDDIEAWLEVRSGSEIAAALSAYVLADRAQRGSGKASEGECPSVVRVCNERDIECGRNEKAWCSTCPKRATPTAETVKGTSDV